MALSIQITSLTTKVESFLIEACSVCDEPEQVRYMVNLFADAVESIHPNTSPSREEMVRFCMNHLEMEY